MNRYAPLLVTLVLSAPSLAAAQDQPTDSARLAAIAEFRPGSRVRLSVRGDGRTEGTFVSTHGETIILGIEHSEQRQVPALAVDSAWVRGNAAHTGMIAGGLTGGLLLGSAAAALTSGLCDSSNCDSTGAFFGGAFVGAVVGGFVGAIVGVVIPKWHRQF